MELDNLSREDRNPSTEDHADGQEGAVSELPPTDRGPAAWRLLCAAYVFEALLWGFPLSFGVFQNYYSTLPQFAGNRYVAVVGTIASGISYLGAPLVSPFIRKYSNYRKQMILIGWPLCILGLVAGSFANTLSTLILTQGVMYGVGFLIFYYPILTFVDEFWIARRGLAYGLLCSASGASGTIMPLVLQQLLDKYGYRTTLRAIAVGLFVATAPLVPFLKGRLPPTESGGSGTRSDWSFLRKPLFWIYSVSNLIQGVGYFFPSLFLPSYAVSIGLSKWEGAILLMTMSLSQTIGQFTFGYLSDTKVPLDLLVTVSLVLSSTAAFTLWGLAKSIGPLIVFAMVFGFFGAGYTALWGRMVSAVSKEPAASLSMFTLFCFGKGVGNVFAGPLSGGLISHSVMRGSYAALRYKGIVVLTGTTMLLGIASLGLSYMKPKRQLS